MLQSTNVPTEKVVTLTPRRGPWDNMGSETLYCKHSNEAPRRRLFPTRFPPPSSTPCSRLSLVRIVAAQFTSVATISFPYVYERFLDGADVLRFDMGWIMSAGCFVQMDFHDRVVTSTIGPLAALAVLGSTYVVAWYRNRSCHRALQKVRRKHVSVALWTTFLVYSSVSSTIFKMFFCETLDDGERYLRADYRISCNSSKHQAMQIYAGLMIFVYPVGIPLIYAALLFWGCDALKIAAVRNMDQSHVQAAAQLSSPYRPGCFYYEVIECGRRVLLTGESGRACVHLVDAREVSNQQSSRNAMKLCVFRIGEGGHTLNYVSMFSPPSPTSPCRCYRLHFPQRAGAGRRDASDSVHVCPCF